MQITSPQFKKNAARAIHDPQLQSALLKMQEGAVERRAEKVAQLPEFSALREIAKQIKDHTLAHLDYYLTEYEKNVIASGGQVHWARNDEEAKEIVLAICQTGDGKVITKGKSMLTEEIDLNEHLIKNNFEVI